MVVPGGTRAASGATVVPGSSAIVVAPASSGTQASFFFSSRRRHTRYWRDWSSDVCSSDLGSLSRLLAMASLDGRRINLDLAAETVRHYSTAEAEPVKVDVQTIIEVVSEHF